MPKTDILKHIYVYQMYKSEHTDWKYVYEIEKEKDEKQN